MLSEEVPATNEAGVKAPAVQFLGEGMESVEQREKAAYTILAEFKSWTCYRHSGERAIAQSPGPVVWTGEKNRSQCVLLNSCRYGRKSPVWNRSVFTLRGSVQERSAGQLLWML